MIQILFFLVGNMTPLDSVECPSHGFSDGRRIFVAAKRIPGKDYEGRPMCLQRSAAEAYLEMTEAAARDGIFLGTTAAYRSYHQQKRLYRKNPRLAAKPGHSTHQEGLSVDVSNAISRRGKKTQVYYWLRNNAKRYGFVPDVSYEPWHWSFRLNLKEEQGDS